MSDKERDTSRRSIAKTLLPSLRYKHFDTDSNMSDALQCEELLL